jgi:hypothetical protein
MGHQKKLHGNPFKGPHPAGGCPDNVYQNDFSIELMDLYYPRPFEISSRKRQRFTDSSGKMDSIHYTGSNNLNPGHKSDLYQGISPGPIPKNDILGSALKIYLLSHLQDDWRYLVVPLDIQQIVGNELKRYMCSVQAYIDAYNNEGPISKYELADRISDYDFSKDLKRIKYKSFIESRSLRNRKTPEWWDNTRSFNIEDIGMIFNYSYCFFWEEDDSEDYKFGDIPLKMDYSFEHKFKEVFESLLTFEILPVYEEEILLSESDSSCLTSDLKNISLNWKEKTVNNSFSEEPLIGKRCRVPVSPQGYRDSVILSVPHTNSIKLIEKQCALIVSKMRGSAYGLTDEELTQKLESFRRYNGHFIDRDIKKEGITKPRILIKWVGEVLKSRYPQMPAWRYLSIYEDFKLILEEAVINPIRGHGLGMANALTTMIQIIIFNLVIAHAKDEGEFFVEEIESLSYNDDFTVGFKNEEDMISYWEYEEIILKKLGIIGSYEKSHQGYDFVFLEEYVRPFSDKKSYLMNELYLPFSAPTIVEAKEFLSNLQFSMTGSKAKDLLDDLISFWGYEFYPEEGYKPFIFGGWFRPKYNKIDISFHVTDIGFPQIKALLSQKERGAIFTKTPNEIFIDPIAKLYGTDMIFPKHVQYFLNYLPTLREKIRKYKRKLGNRNLEIYALTRKKNRMNTYNKHSFTFLPSMTEIYNIASEIFSELDILPPKEIVYEDNYTTEDTLLDREFLIVNPILSTIKGYYPDKIPDYILPDRQAIYKKYKRYQGLGERDHLSYDFQLYFWDTVPEVEVGKITNVSAKRSRYINNDHIASVWYKLYGNLTFPYYPIEGRSENYENELEGIQKTDFSPIELRRFMMLLASRFSYKDALSICREDVWEKIKELVSVPEEKEIEESEEPGDPLSEMDERVAYEVGILKTIEDAYDVDFYEANIQNIYFVNNLIDTYPKLRRLRYISQIRTEKVRIQSSYGSLDRPIIIKQRFEVQDEELTDLPFRIIRNEKNQIINLEYTGEGPDNPEADDDEEFFFDEEF